MPNQYPPNRKSICSALSPIEDLAQHIYPLWQLRRTDEQILKELLEKHIDRTKYGLGITRFREFRKRLGLERTRQQGHTIETITEPMKAIRRRFAKAGAEEARNILFMDYKMMVSRHLIITWFRIYEPELIKERKARNLRRRRFWSAGVNDILAVDQHDKWKRFGLALHTGIDPFSGRIHWIKIYWTNNNPKVILSYYIEFIRTSGYIPLVTQSDLGSENYGIANAHTTLRHLHDPSLQGTIQHRWMRAKKNVKPEIIWSVFRRTFAPSFETLLDLGVNEGWYDMIRPLDVLLFRWLFIPWLQKELDRYVYRRNHSLKRRDRNKILPHGRAQEIHTEPQRFGCLDFKIPVNPAFVDQVEAMYAPPDNPCFDLVPPAFAGAAARLYAGLGSPPLSEENIWSVYRDMLANFEQMDDGQSLVEECQVYLTLAEENHQMEQPDGAQLFGGDESLDEEGNFYMGGVNNGRGLDQRQLEELDNLEDGDNFEFAVEFSDDEDEANPDDANEW